VRIGEVAKQAGIAPSAIRFYESVGILSRPQRRNGVREYDASVVDQLRVLQFLRGGGLSIQSLAATDRHSAVERRIVEIDVLIEQLEAQKKRLQSLLACDCKGDTTQCVIYSLDVTS